MQTLPTIWPFSVNAGEDQRVPHVAVIKNYRAMKYSESDRALPHPPIRSIDDLPDSPY